MGLFRNSSRDSGRLAEQVEFIRQKEHAEAQLELLLSNRDDIESKIALGLITEKSQEMVDGAAQAFAAVYSIRFGVVTIRRFNKAMGTLAADDFESIEMRAMEFHEFLVPRLGKLLVKVSKDFPISEYEKFRNHLDGRFGEGKFGLKLGMPDDPW